MSDKAKKGLKLAGYAAVILLTAFILYHLFKDSYKEIAAQLIKTNIWMLLLMILLGNMYYFIDAIMYSYLLKKDGTPVNMLRCIAVSYMGIFFNVTTFGAGIKPGQVVYLHNKCRTCMRINDDALCFPQDGYCWICGDYAAF